MGSKYGITLVVLLFHLSTNASDKVILSSTSEPVSFLDDCAESSTMLTCNECSNYFGTSIKCEDFDNLQLGAVSPQGSDWSLWPNTNVDAMVTNEQAYQAINENSKSLKVERVNNSQPDVLYNINQSLDEDLQLKFQMYIPQGRSGYFNIQSSEEPIPGGALQVYFNNSGSSQVLERLTAGFNEVACFNFPKDEWFEIVLTFEAGGSSATLVISGRAVYQWAYAKMTVGAINLYAVQNSLFYTDDFCLSKGRICDIITIGQQACSNNIGFNAACFGEYGVTEAEPGFCFGITNSICGTTAIPLQCGVTRVDDNYSASNNLNKDFYLNSCGSSSIDQSLTYNGNDKVYCIYVDGPEDLIISLSDFKNEVDLDLFILQCQEEPTVFSSEIEDCLMGLEDTNPSDTEERYVIPNADGLYYLVVDGEDACQLSTFSIKVDCGANLPFVCDLGGTIIDRGIPYTINLTDQNRPLSEYSFQGLDCVLDQYGPTPSSDLVTQSFLYNSPGGEAQFLYNPTYEDVSIFIFDCRCDPEVHVSVGACPPKCLGSFPASFIPPDFQSGYYSILVVGKPGQSATFRSFPTDICTTPELIQCNVGPQSFTVEGKENDLRRARYSSSGCYNDGSRSFEGEDIEFQFIVTERSFVNITLNAAEAMGMFLYNYNCGRECLDRALNPYAGGTAVITAELGSGRYNLVVDKDLLGGDGRFTLDIECVPNSSHSDFVLSSDFNDCVINENSWHTINFLGLENTFSPSDLLQPGAKIGIFYRDESNTNLLSAGQEDWTGGQTAIRVYEDDANDEVKCGFDLNEDFIMQTYTPTTTGDGPFANLVRGVFSNGATSFTGNNQSSLVTNLERVSSNYLACGESTKTFEQPEGSKFVTINSNDNWQVIEELDVPWMSVNEINEDGFDINVLANNSTSIREATLLITSTNGLKCEYLVKQRGACIAPEILFNEAYEITCAIPVIRLEPEVNAATTTLFYEWKNSNGQTISNLPQIQVSEPGKYNLLVRDEEGNCSTSQEVNVTLNTTQPIPIIETPERLTCQTPEVELEVNISLADEFNLNWVANNGGNIISNPQLNRILVNASGSYEVFVTREDNGCSASAKIDVIQNTEAPVVEIEQPETLNCFNNTVQLRNVSANQGSVEYKWSIVGEGNIVSNPNSRIIQVDEPGTYSLMVMRNDNGCQADGLVEVIEILPPVGMVVLVDSVSCAGSSDGLAKVVASGGVPGYSFEWSNGSLGDQASMLPTGEVTVTVTDELGCSSQINLNVLEPEVLAIELVILDQSVVGENNGSIQVEVSGGTKPYNYNWSTGNVGDTIIETLAPGNYALTVEDANGCSVEQSMVIQPVECTGISISVELKEDVECIDDENGKVNLLIDGAEGEVGYFWSDSTIFGPAPTDLSAGIYDLTVTDQKGCVGMISVEIISTDVIAPIIKTRDLTLQLDEQGQASITAEQVDDGTSDNCGIGSIEISQNNFSCQDIGEQFITFMAVDWQGNRDSTEVRVSVVDQLSPILDCPSDFVTTSCILEYDLPIVTDNCSSSIDLQLLTMEYGLGDTVALNSPPLEITYQAEDESGNQTVCSFKVSVANDLQVLLDSLFPATPGASNGEIQVSISGGIMPYVLEWYKEGEFVSSDEDLNQISPGAYRLVVVDAVGCEYVFSVDLITNVSSQDIKDKIDIFPNPTSGEVQINVELRETKDVQISLWDYSGKQLQVLTRTQVQNEYLKYDLQRFPSGLYILYFQIGEKHIMKKIILNK